ncbi:MAG: RHS domain-containing protein, partial [Myxococcales bacterium]|nr:RHS domain-containing protein [Myxococcales bacterium]
ALVPFMAVDYASREEATERPEDGDRYYYFTDHRGCPERVEDDDGEVVWEATVHPYGECEVHVGADFHQPLRFPGHYHDATTGLHCNRFRYYSPELGRYLESDPVGIQGGLNLYGYCADGNPLRDVDLRGLSGCPDDCPPQAAPEEGPAAEEVRLSPNGQPMVLRPSLDGTGPPRWTLVEGTRTPSRRETDFPSGYRASTWEALAMLHTDEGRMQGRRPMHTDANGVEVPTPYHELTWRDGSGERIDTTPRPASAGPPPTPARHMGDLTFDHQAPCAQMWNESVTVGDTTYPPGHDTSRATRATFYNDPANLVPATWSDNSSRGSQITRPDGHTERPRYTAQPGPNYSNDST